MTWETVKTRDIHLAYEKYRRGDDFLRNGEVKKKEEVRKSYCRIITKAIISGEGPSDTVSGMWLESTKEAVWMGYPRGSSINLDENSRRWHNKEVHYVLIKKKKETDVVGFRKDHPIGEG